MLEARKRRAKVMAEMKLEEYIWDRWGPREEELHTAGLWIRGVMILPGFTVVSHES